MRIAIDPLSERSILASSAGSSEAGATRANPSFSNRPMAGLLSSNTATERGGLVRLEAFATARDTRASPTPRPL